jgi:hypothetical protein
MADAAADAANAVSTRDVAVIAGAVSTRDVATSTSGDAVIAGAISIAGADVSAGANVIIAGAAVVSSAEVAGAIVSMAGAGVVSSAEIDPRGPKPVPRRIWTGTTMTKLCRFYMEGGRGPDGCQRGEYCTFAHSEDEVVNGKQWTHRMVMRATMVRCKHHLRGYDSSSNPYAYIGASRRRNPQAKAVGVRNRRHVCDLK